MSEKKRKLSGKIVPDRLEFEDILEKVGSYGAYQRNLLYFFMIPTTIIFSLYCMNTFFMLSEPEHWCYIEALSNESVHVQRLLTRPSNGDGKFDSCSYNDINYSSELNRLRDHIVQFNGTSDFRVVNSTRRKCSQWTYDKTNYDYNAVTEMNLVCDRKNWKSFVLSTAGLGEVVGNPFFGLLSDKFGRHRVFFVAVAAAILSSISPIIPLGFVGFTICRFLNSFTTASLYNLPYIIMTELVGPKQRARLVGIGAICWTIGMCILPLIAYLTRNYVTLTIVPTLFVLPVAIYWKFLPESPRWLLSQNRYDEAYAVIANIARTNGKIVPPDLMSNLIAFNQKKKRDSLQPTSNLTVNGVNDKSARDVEQGFFTIFRYPNIRRNFLILTLAWVANVCAYRGLTLNFENFYGNEFVNWLLLSAVEFPSNLFSWFLIETLLGRRWSQSISMTLGGIAFCLPVFIPTDMPTAVIVVSLAGKFLCNMAYNVVYQQTAELMPTPVRNQGMSYTTAVAAGANFALPYLASLGKVDVWVPLIIIGIVCVISGFCSAFLPETLHKNLPQTIKDGDDLNKNFVFFSFAPQGIVSESPVSDDDEANTGKLMKSSERETSLN